MKRGPGSLLGLFARSSRSEQSELRARKETATKVGAGILGAAALAALFLGVRHYQGRSLAQLLAILRDVTIDEETKRTALIGASPKDRASVLADLPAFATLVTQSAASTIMELCDVLCLVPESARELGHNQRRAILGCGTCCEPDNEPEMGAGTTTDVPELVRRVRLNAAQSGTALAKVLGKHRVHCDHALPRVLSICLDGKVATTVETLKMLAAISKNIPDRTIDLMAITQITTGATSVEELDAIRDIDPAKFKFERATALAAFTGLELGGQSILAYTVLRVINPDWRTCHLIEVPLPDGATLSERVRAHISAATWTGDEESALNADIASKGTTLPPIDRLRSEYILGGNAIVVRTYTPVEHMIIFQDLWGRPELRAAAYKSPTFGPHLRRVYPRGWFTMLTWMHDENADAYKVALASVTLDEASTLAIEELLSTSSMHASRVLGHVLALLPPDGVPNERLLRVLGAATMRRAFVATAQTRALVSTIERWPVSIAMQASFCLVARDLEGAGIGPTDKEHAGAIVDAAIKAARGGFSEIAQVLCEFAGKEAVKLKMDALLAQTPPSPDIVHLALSTELDEVDNGVASAVRADPALRKLVVDTARRNAAGFPSTRAAALLEFVKARDIVSQFGMLYT